jgi:hypothetical protein
MLTPLANPTEYLSYSYQFSDLAALASPGPDSSILTPLTLQNTYHILINSVIWRPRRLPPDSPILTPSREPSVRHSMNGCPKHGQTKHQSFRTVMCINPDYWLAGHACKCGVIMWTICLFVCWFAPLSPRGIVSVHINEIYHICLQDIHDWHMELFTLIFTSLSHSTLLAVKSFQNALFHLIRNSVGF